MPGQYNRLIGESYGKWVILLDKAIYGMAQPFDDFYFEYDLESNTFDVSHTHQDAVTFQSLVGITLSHEYDKVFGTTDENLFLQVTDTGVYFKLIPNSPLGESVFKKVTRAALRHCSISYKIINEERNNLNEERVTSIFRERGFDDIIVVQDLKEILIFEICICNYPANKMTFVTTDVNDPRIAGLGWSDIDPIPRPLIRERPNEELRFKKKVQLHHDIANLTRDIKNLKEDIRRITK